MARLLILAVYVLSLIGGLEADSKDCFCGSSARSQKSIKVDDGRNGSEDALPAALRFRIIGGKAASDLSWMAYVGVRSTEAVRQRSRSADIGTCGGAVVAESFVLSAAHCFYNAAFNVTKPLQVFVILGTHDVTKTQKAFFSPAEAIIAHPEYNWQTVTNDVALIRLMAKVDFDKWPGVRTLCLPTEDAFDAAPVGSAKATVAGWGVTEDKFCKTTNAGPEKFAICRFPFRIKDAQGETSTVGSCTAMPTPSEQDPVCKKFFNSALDLKVEPTLMKNMYAIEDAEGKIRHCYHRHSSGDKSLGWCATCNVSASAGQPGHCGSDRSNPAEMTPVTTDSGWGWCDVTCGKDSFLSALKLDQTTGPASQYTYTELDVLGEENCAITLKRHNASKVLCVASKKKYEPAPTYRMLKLDAKTENVSFVKKSPEAGKHYRSGFYFGGTDSCTGDSGSPLWRKVRSSSDGREINVAVGVVSTGAACASNLPAAYTRLRAFSKWLFGHLNDTTRNCPIRIMPNGLYFQRPPGYEADKGSQGTAQKDKNEQHTKEPEIEVQEIEITEIKHSTSSGGTTLTLESSITSSPSPTLSSAKAKEGPANRNLNRRLSINRDGVKDSADLTLEDYVNLEKAQDSTTGVNFSPRVGNPHQEEPTEKEKPIQDRELIEDSKSAPVINLFD